MVALNISPRDGGSPGCPPGGDASSSMYVLMCVKTINLTTRAKTYEFVPKKTSDAEDVD